MKTSGIIKRVLIISSVALITFVIIGLILFFFPSNAYRRSSRSVADYNQFKNGSAFNSVLFPDAGLLSEEDCVFYDEYRFDGSNTPQYLTYAFCSFSEAEFNQELSRLDGLASKYSETLFNKPAYILFLNLVGSSEYAIVDREQCTIHYISYCSKRFYDRLPSEDRIKPEFAETKVEYRDIDLFLDQHR